jgi:hypothetical protein
MTFAKKNQRLSNSISQIVQKRTNASAKQKQEGIRRGLYRNLWNSIRLLIKRMQLKSKQAK